MGSVRNPEVLVIGSGPTALTTGTILAGHGVDIRVVSKSAGPISQSRALVVQARTIELWHKLGLAQRAISEGHPVNGAVGLQDGRALNGGRPLFDFSDIGAGQTPYPFLLVHEQSQTEPMLLNHLTGHGGTVEWETEVIGVRPQTDHVEVDLRRVDGTQETVRPRWVVAADGASSAVRHALALSFEGDTYESTFFLADVALDWRYGHDQLFLGQTNAGTFLFVPMPDRGDSSGPGRRFRVLASTAPEDSDRTDLDVDVVQQAIDERSGISARISDPRWVSLYRLHHRMAEHFRVGRVFLAGDAAHIHSPIGGQGMNTGIQDAYNLAWKLALVVRGDARPELLETYEAERRPVAQALLGTTDRAFRTLVSEKRLVRLGRKIAGVLIPVALARLPRLRRRLFAAVSQVAISYADNTASRGQPGPQPGDRAPHAVCVSGPAAGRSVFDLFVGLEHHLLVLTGGRAPGRIPAGEGLTRVQDVLGRFSVPIQVHVLGPEETAVHHAYGADQPTMFLIRPDGYLAWRGRLDASDELENHLNRWYSRTRSASST